MATDHEYVGDAVYASVESGGVLLTTGSHEAPAADNQIFLEREVLEKFLRWLERMKQQKKLL